MQLPIASTLLVKAHRAESKHPDNEQPHPGGVGASDDNEALVALYEDIKAMDVEGIFASPDAAVWGESHPANVRCSWEFPAPQLGTHIVTYRVAARCWGQSLHVLRTCEKHLCTTCSS